VNQRLRQADALAEADNLRCGIPSDVESDSRAANAEGFRQNMRRHMATIQTAMTLSTGDDAVTRRVGFDLAQANAGRAAWMVEAQQLVEQAPLRGTGAVAVATAPGLRTEWTRTPYPGVSPERRAPQGAACGRMPAPAATAQ